MSTKPCPQCGSAVPVHARFCGQCGHTFTPTTLDESSAPVPSSRRAPVGMGTMIGHAPLVAPVPAATPDAPPAPAKPERTFAKTIVQGGADVPPSSSLPTVRGEPPAQALAASRPAELGMQKTMLGIPAVGLNLPQPATPQPTPTPAKAFPAAAKTMLGVAIPGIAPTQPEPPKAAPPSRAGTLLGVAVPGIAPVRPGKEKTASHRVQRDLPRAPAIVPAPAPLVEEPLPEAPKRPVKRGIPITAVVGIVFVLVAGAAVAILLLLRPAAPLNAQPQLDETGKESLKIACPSCPDGTMITLGASSAKVEGSAALLPLPAPLSIGDNDLEMKIDRPSAGRDETVKVHVPVAYRVKTDLSTLTASSPVITVQVDATPGTEVTVDGKPVSLNGGKGSHAVDIASELEGPSDEPKTIDKKIPFSVKAKGASAPETGQLTLRVAVTPLHLDAPGLELYTDRPTGNISGQVRPNSTLTVDGQSVPVDAQGRFGVRVELPTTSEKNLTIVASAPPSAPRIVRTKITRVTSLPATAKLLDGRAPLSFENYASDPKAKIGKLVVVEGELQEVRVAQGQTAMAIEEKTSCTRGPGACVVRVVHGEEIKAQRGDTVRAYGRVVGTSTFNGTTIPSIEGVLVTTKPAARK